ncbi:3-deoxy-7-phosphoheptulonate synthase [Sulfuriroseicoccus oceanibius]|uniref:Phospho-2-dehydro-3-deoxyheptonate aldolase n=1 Tax=Sulfuriroseicoccus oceanibius TaxID=2707525 RepID=A0A6B3LDM7_9BACT|nr:3-deoxy-7-phosphoheptulonate synthase [Sulfuriroseicoccus oceanibius]QQL44883.1 3-deoxy-7-phosphoheptulonate synthase [Sulfuriroseicoccus oceanibius]
MKNTDDLRIAEIDPLMAPQLLMKELPVSDKASELVAATRAANEAILNRNDPRLLVVVGPCSIHDTDAALEYGHQLKELAEKHKDTLVIVMRVYFEKPRTTIGWKGLINDPCLDDSFDINRGLHTARKLLIDLANMGVPAGTEFLDTISPQYIADLVTWGAIGARTTESQVHRELASGLSMPVGFKNGTGGSLQIAIDAIKAASYPHHFLSVTKHGVAAIVTTEGNEACHVILRGASSGPNYDAGSVAKACADLKAAGLTETVMIDCSHGNSKKDYRNQPGVASTVAAQIAEGNKAITSVMIESNLHEGNQPLAARDQLAHGVSITDACVNWETTVAMIEELSDAVKSRMAK